MFDNRISEYFSEGKLPSQDDRCLTTIMAHQGDTHIVQRRDGITHAIKLDECDLGIIIEALIEIKQKQNEEKSNG